MSGLLSVFAIPSGDGGSSFVALLFHFVVCFVDGLVVAAAAAEVVVAAVVVVAAAVGAFIVAAAVSFVFVV